MNVFDFSEETDIKERLFAGLSQVYAAAHPPIRESLSLDGLGAELGAGPAPGGGRLSGTAKPPNKERGHER